MKLNFALAGNPNCGKTTLFNILTGSRAQVGNWPGVTVEKKTGTYLKNKSEISIVDLPGIYSLSPYTQEEVIARDFLSGGNVDLIINIVDATNIERNLYLTTQLMELNIPIIVALNMMDEVKAKGDEIDVSMMEERLGLTVVPISASKGQGINELMQKAMTAVLAKVTQRRSILLGTQVFELCKKVDAILNDSNCEHTMFHTVKLVERDEKIAEGINLSEHTLSKIDALLESESKNFTTDYEIAIADSRYKKITSITSKCVKKVSGNRKPSATERIDSIVTHKYLALPVFVLLMFLVFQISVGPISEIIKEPLDLLFGEIIPNSMHEFLLSAGASSYIIGIVVDGILAGIGSVISFLPQIILLFFCLSLLEDTGYMARAAFIMDRVFRNFGLTGKSFVPLLMGFGCSVPGIMATRTLEDVKSRRMTIILIPFMSCSARLPVYIVFAGTFFPSHQGFVIFALYILGIIVALLSGVLLKKTLFKGESAPFVMELPPYRLPTAKTVFLHLWEKAKGYVVRVGTILLAMSIVIWLLQSVDFSFKMVEDSSNSIFGGIGRVIAPFFAPLGLGDWPSAVALLTGLIAKEAVVSSLGILYGAADIAASGVLALHFTPLTSISFLVFVLLYTPCVSAIATAKKEFDSWRWTVFSMFYQCCTAWVISFIVFQGGKLLGFS